MKKTILAILLSVLMITTVFAIDYRYPAGGPTSTADSNVRNVTLTGESLSINYSPTSGVIGLDNQTALVATLIPGNQYSVSVTWGTFGGNYSGAGSVWIDWNQDESYATTEVIGSWTGTPTATESYTFTVPAVFTGSTRMRVMQREGGSLPLDPAVSYSWGSNMDFTISEYVAGAPDIPELVSPANGATNVAIDTNLEWTTGANTEHAVLYIADNASFTGATEVDPASSPYTTDLATGITYYWKVVAVSATSVEMSSPVRSFTTELGPGNYIWEIIDSYGDGWNGAAMNVLVDGLVVLENITMTGGSSAEFVFSAQMGQTITSNFHTGGSYPGECFFDLYDYEGNLLAEGNASTPISYFIPYPGTPDAPTLESPADGATNVTLVSDLEWSIGDNTDSVILYLADNEEFTGATEVELAHTDTLYTTATLAYNTTYYWKVEALNTVDGYLTSSAVWSFRTEYGVATVPYSENFDAYAAGVQPDGWITLNTTGNTSATSAVSSTYPVSAPRSYYMTNSSVSSGGSLIASTPRMENAGNRVRFSARGASAGFSLFVGTMTDPTDENTFTRIDSLLLTATHTQYIVELPADREVNYISFKHGLGGTSRSIYLDNVSVEEIPTAAVIEFTPESIDCGLYLLGDTTAVAQTITVTNVGAVAAEITEITVGHPSYFEVIDENTLPYILEPQASMTVDVKALTSFVGLHDSYVRFKEKIDLFTFTNHDIDVTSEILSSTGDNHNDPFTLNVASQIIVNHSTSPYNATYAFCTAKSVVYKLSLPQSKIMDISLEGTTWDTKLWVFNSFDQIDTATQNSDAWYYNDDETSAGTGGSRFIEEEKSRDRALWSKMNPSFALAGDYYIIVSGFSTNNGPFTMTINTEAIPAPAAASAPYPADDAIDLPTSFNLAWTNAAYTETVDIYFGQAGSMVLVQDNIAAVDEYAVSELDPDREYEWKVVNRNYTGETPAVDVVTWSFTTIGTPPVAATYTAPADDAVDVAVNGNLTWQAVTGAEGYRVYLSTDSLFTTVTPVEQTATTYAYSGAYGQTYYWKVLPYNVVGVPTEGVNVWSFTVLEDPFPEADLVLDGVRSINHGMPMEPGTVYTTTQNIYYQADLDFEDSAITSISYLYNSFSAFTEEVDIYMGHTIKNTFADNYDWELDGMTLVFRGILTATTTEAIVNLELDTPFVYNNTDNLVVTFMAKQAGSQSYSADFYNYAVTGNRSIRVTGSTFYPLSGTIPYGTLKAFLPVTGFNYEDLAAEAVFTVSADTLTYVDQIMDEESDPQTVIVSNGGIADLGIVSIAISGTNADQFQLTDTNTYPVTLATAENMSVQVVYAPTTEGDHTAQLEITDNQARTLYTVELVGNSIDTNIYAEDLPWNESFEGNLLGWWAIVQSTSDYAAITVTTTATNVQHGSKAISFYNSGDLSPNLQLVAPNLVPDMAGYRLRFWMKGTAGSEMILGKYDTDMQVLTAVDTFVVPLTYEQTVIEFEAARANERFVFIPTFDTTYDYVYLDNVTFEETPLLPVAELNVTALDFGDVELTTTSVAEEVSITNVGPGTLTITNVEITGTDAGLFAWDYVEETPDMALETGETLELTLTFTPDALGLKEATLVITDDLGSRIRINSASKASNNSRNANEVALTGTGWLPPQGSTCADPLPLTFPAVGVTGNTADYGDDYENAWISPSSSYLNGDDVVYQFTLANSMLLNGTITTTGSWIGAFILQDEPNADTPAVVTLSKTSSSTTLTYANDMIPAGTYYLIISSYPAPQSIDYTINLTANPLPAPAAATNPSPADQAIDRPTALNLGWTNAANTETIDLYFGEVGDREMALVLNDVAVVNSHAVTDLDPNTEYAWKVINRNYSGETADTLVTTWTFTTIGNPPAAVTYTAPADEATNRPLSGNLSWQAATGASGYYVYLSEDETFTGVTPVDQAGTSYAYSGLDYLTPYYWKVIPYNVVGQPTEGILVWSFTTIPDPTISTFPWTETFTTWPAENWSQFSGILAETTPIATGSNWYHRAFANIGSTANSAYLNIYGTRNHWLVTPPINLDASVETLQLDFDIALTTYTGNNATALSTNDYVAVVISTDNGVTWSNLNVLQDWANGDAISHTGDTYAISLEGYSGIVKFGFYAERPSGFSPDINVYFDNITIKESEVVADPEIPVNFTIAMDGASITLTWDSAANASSYNVYGCDTPDGEYVFVENVDGLTTTLTATEQMKFYRVKGSNSGAPDSVSKRFGRK